MIEIIEVESTRVVVHHELGYKLENIIVNGLMNFIVIAADS